MGEDWIFYTSAFIIVQMMLFWSHGMTLIVPGIGMDWKKMLLNPNIIAIGIGLVLFAARIRMPVVIDTAVAGFGDMIGPISMLAIGMLIGEMDLREVFASRRAYLVCLVRLILLPGLAAVCFALAVHSGFTQGYGIYPDGGAGGYSGAAGGNAYPDFSDVRGRSPIRQYHQRDGDDPLYRHDSADHCFL